MACENSLSISPGKRKTGNNDVSVEAAEIEARELPSDLAALATCKRSSPNHTEERNKLHLLEEEEECPATPRSEKHKIPVMTCCPLAPIKPRSTSRKRKPEIPPGTLYIPFDFPQLDLLFGSESKSIAKHKKKKMKKALHIVYHPIECMDNNNRIFRILLFSRQNTFGSMKPKGESKFTNFVL
jgi:hypothetical protein